METPPPQPPKLPWRWAIYNSHEPPPAPEFGIIRDAESCEAQNPQPHVTYWWQIEALLKYQRQVASYERSYVAEALIELRNDE